MKYYFALSAGCLSGMILTGSVLAANGGIEVGLSGLASSGASSVNQVTLSTLQAGGHDPSRNGFTIQNVEVTLGGAVDPYFDAQANLVFQINAEGETVVELEEAYLQTRALPAALQFKFGQFFTEFGRRNAQHPHSWWFADQPVILSRLFGGDGLRSQGARVSWLSPLPWYSELFVSLQNAAGETAKSFINAPGEDIAGFTLSEREPKGFKDFISMLRWKNGLDLSDTFSANLGVSMLGGPNATGTETATHIYGSDLYLKWQAKQSSRGFPFVVWHTEYLTRRYEALDHNDVAHETLQDSGWFSSLSWGFQPGWIGGVRYEMATAIDASPDDADRNDRQRLSVALTWLPTEFSKLRLQYNYDQAPHLVNDVHAVWMQFEYNLGKHMAHTF